MSATAFMHDGTKPSDLLWLHLCPSQPTNLPPHRLKDENELRWYRALCRFVPPMLSDLGSPLVRDERVIRWTLKSFAMDGRSEWWPHLQAASGPVIISWNWDHPAFYERLAEGLDLCRQVATQALGTSSNRILQIAFVSPQLDPEMRLMACEAGISVCFDAVDDFPKCRRAILRHACPLG